MLVRSLPIALSHHYLREKFNALELMPHVKLFFLEVANEQPLSFIISWQQKPYFIQTLDSTGNPCLGSAVTQNEFNNFIQAVKEFNLEIGGLIEYFNLISEDEITATSVPTKLFQQPNVNKQRSLFYFHHHNDTDSMDLIAKELEARDDVTHFFFELPNRILANVFDHFNQSKDLMFLAFFLRQTVVQFPNLIEGWIKIAGICSTKNIKVMAVDTTEVICQNIDTTKSITTNPDRIFNDVKSMETELSITRRDNVMESYMLAYCDPSATNVIMGVFGLAHKGLSKSLGVPSCLVATEPKFVSDKLKAEYDQFVGVQNKAGFSYKTAAVAFFSVTAAVTAYFWQNIPEITSKP